MSIELELQIASNATTLPHPSQFRDWISIALENKIDNTELTIRIVDLDEMIDLNKRYRNKNQPTNVLSFSGKTEFDLDNSHDKNTNSNFGNTLKDHENILGDIVICAPVMEQEAKEHNKDLIAHWAHIVIHGALHLIGYNHDTKLKAEKMEGLETELLVKLSFNPPYGDTIDYE